MSPPAPALDAIDWQELLETPSIRHSLPRLLETLCSASRLEAAAAYAPRDGGWVRLGRAGRADFPATLERDADAGFQRADVAGGVLLYRSAIGETLPPDGACLLAVATALRAVALEERLKQHRFEAAYRGVELEALYDVGLAIASTLNLEELGEEVLLRAGSLLDARRGALYLVSRGRYRLQHTLGGDAVERAALDDPRVEALLASRPAAEGGLLPGASHLIASPVEADGKRLGLLVVGDKESRRGVGPFGDADRRTLSLFANQAAIALENAHLHRQALEKERLERELELAADIQRRLLPARLPRVEGLEVLGWSRQARHVGGDYYDLVEQPGGALVAVLADVSGKGMPAALLVSTVHSALRLLLDKSSLGPELIARLNQHVVESSAPNHFITLLAAELTAPRDELRYVNAGHNPGLVLRRSGEVEQLGASGFPLGLFPGTYESGRLELRTGDLVCFYSDGITESIRPGGEEFGAGRLIDLLRSLADRPLDEISRAVDEAVTGFARGRPQGDDQTLLFLRRSG